MRFIGTSLISFKEKARALIFGLHPRKNRFKILLKIEREH
jgi:hypothetical protein